MIKYIVVWQRNNGPFRRSVNTWPVLRKVVSGLSKLSSPQASKIAVKLLPFMDGFKTVYLEKITCPLSFASIVLCNTLRILSLVM